MIQSNPRLGIAGYLRILRGIRTHPATAQEISARMSIHLNTVQKVLRWMMRAGLVHREGWHRVAPSQPLRPVWHWGGDGDVPNPIGRSVGIAPSNHTVLLLGTIREVLLEGPTTTVELASQLAMNSEYVRRILKQLHRAQMIRITGWHQHRTGGMPAPMFAWGYGPDKAKPTVNKSAQQVRWQRTKRAKLDQIRLQRALAGCANDEQQEAA